MITSQKETAGIVSVRECSIQLLQLGGYSVPTLQSPCSLYENSPPAWDDVLGSLTTSGFSERKYVYLVKIAPTLLFSSADMHNWFLRHSIYILPRGKEKADSLYLQGNPFREDNTQEEARHFIEQLLHLNKTSVLR